MTGISRFAKKSQSFTIKDATLMSQSFTSMDARTQPFNSSKIYEWLLNNDCPWEWEPVNSKDANSLTLIFTNKPIYPEPDGEPSY